MTWYLPDRYPLFWHEARRRLFQLRKPPARRRAMVYALRGLGVAGLLALIVIATINHFIHRNDTDLFWYFLSIQGLTLALISPGLSAWTITEERNKGTFESLLALPFSSRALVLQKYAYIAGVALFVFLLFLPCTLPALITSPRVWAFGYALTVSGIACYLAVGLMMGCQIKAAWLASLLSYVAAFSLTPFLGVGLTIEGTNLLDLGLLAWHVPAASIGLTILSLWLAIRAVERLRGR